MYKVQFYFIFLILFIVYKQLNNIKILHLISVVVLNFYCIFNFCLIYAKHLRFIHFTLNILLCVAWNLHLFCCMVCYLFVAYYHGQHGSAIITRGARKSCTLPAGFHGGPGNYVRVSNT